MDTAQAQGHIDRIWDDSIVPTLTDYIRIPNKSPLFDPDWAAHGHMDHAVDLMADWARSHGVPGMTLDIIRLEGRTPVILMEIPGTGSGRGLLYGHLDKQPETEGWQEGLGPWNPVLRGDRLYGRGGADDGYALFASLTAFRILHEQGIEHAPCTILIESSEESGSPDLPAYMAHLADRIGDPDLVICLDSGAGNYEQMWCTTSLRGLVGGDLSVEVLEEGVHSGDASGVVPSSFRILRQLLDRIEDVHNGWIIPPEFHTSIPRDRLRQAHTAAQVLGDAAIDRYPFAGDTQATTRDGVDALLNRTWRPALEITGGAGLPPLDSAGNVLRPRTSAKLSLRIPPLVDGKRATATLKQILEANPPHRARVRFEPEWDASGWNAPPFAPWLEEALERGSQAFFGKGAVHTGEGFSIPFMAMLAEQYPRAQFMITGVLGPHSNAHGPNEFLHIPMAKGLTGCVATVLEAHGRRAP
ncbi:MAG: M20 family metallopeptidase [Gammaproteobacteria bacterium]